MTDMTRRTLLTRATALGCSVAASPLAAPISWAAGPWDNRLVVIVLRGGMDGLDVVRPLHDPNYLTRRPETSGTMMVEDGWGLHPALEPVLPLWQAGEFSVMHATSTPYRNKRSHFDGQDHLEAGFGTPDLGPVRDGWLNRFLQTQPGSSHYTAFALGSGDMLLTRGAADIARWSPGADLLMSDQTLRLAELVMHDDALFQSQFGEALAHARSDGGAAGVSDDDMARMDDVLMSTLQRPARAGDVARFATEQLRADARLVSFSLTGWDTHRRQDKTLPRALARLSTALTTLKEGLGPIWSKTTVLVVTEFGRTATFNGTGGTDHGTGGALLLAGGTLRKAQVAGTWPGLAEADLYQRRDLMPTSDVRASIAWALRHSFGIDQTALETVVFPRLTMGRDPKLFA